MRLRRGCSGAWIALLAAAADRATKALALRACGDGGPLGCSARPLVTGVLNLNVTRNTGVAFSGLSGRETLVIALALLLNAAVIGWLIARPDAPKGARAGLWLIAGGGLSNLYDRLRWGCVIDFLEPAFVRFAIFNVADMCICCGAALAFIALLRAQRREGAEHGEGV